MFKAQTLRRSFSLFRRVPSSTIIRSAARDGHENVQIQRVRFKRRFFTRPRMIGTTIAVATTYGLWQWLDEEVEEELKEDGKQIKRVKWRKPSDDDNNEEEEVEVEEEEVDEEEEDEETGLIFFPTGLSRPKRKEFYKGSDPEWQEFVKIAPDRQRIDRIRGELISMIRTLAVKNPSYVQRLGKINPNAGSIWIEVRFPDGPPVEYERPGYELTDELNFRKTTRPVDQMHHQRLENALFPTAVATAVYADAKMRALAHWRGFRKYMGWEDERTEKLVKALAQLSSPPSSPPKSPAPTTASSTSAPPLAPSATADTQNKDASSAPSSPPSSNPITDRFGNSLPDPTKVPTMDLSYFRRMIHKNHRHVHMHPPRGTFMVSGLIEIIGERAKMTLDVAAFYDPKMGRYVMLKAKLRSITDYKQSPKGGP
ncbi:hypothetical protein K458DRAFT_347000 [Lentithecium fluviatile CBS 122367]|uniref:Uncharacterized protein n=1 Tax=Lentithecium fluviatile CBS 122367 TaxID=1168545 RepID=A0A6G1IM74_9PLEO|nr:hypothetical protein K458DRAFT_347000 [Lentithecium fluviatile CBS 122367]